MRNLADRTTVLIMMFSTAATIIIMQDWQNDSSADKQQEHEQGNEYFSTATHISDIRSSTRINKLFLMFF